MAQKSIRRNTKAAQKPTRRKAKPKFIEIDGHQLTEDMQADYDRCVAQRSMTNRDNKQSQIEALALGDFLHGYRPSHKVKKQLSDITKEAMDLSLAIGTMRDYTWYAISNSDSIRAAGVELVKKLALDLYNASAKLTAIAMNVETEKTTKLQDWLAQDERLAQIGRRQEVSHG